MFTRKRKNSDIPELSNYEWTAAYQNRNETEDNNFSEGKHISFYYENFINTIHFLVPISDSELCQHLGISNKNEFSQVLMGLLSQYGLSPESISEDSHESNVSQNDHQTSNDCQYVNNENQLYDTQPQCSYSYNQCINADFYYDQNF